MVVWLACLLAQAINTKHGAHASNDSSARSTPVSQSTSGLGLNTTIIVHTPDGLLRGNRRSSSIQLLGVSFGKAPTGQRRWKAPERIDSWEGVVDATAFGMDCLDSGTTSLTGSEDCLSLNVFAPLPLTSKPALHPVIVFFHGGCFIGGNSNEVNWNGTYFVEKTMDTVIVVPNFRKSVYGYLAIQADHRRATDPAHGNYGLQDQREALRWVQRNIAAVGGDPHNVMIMGHSSGAAHVSIHLVSPLSYPLFHKAAMHSGGYGNWAAYDWPASNQNLDLVVRGCGCNSSGSGGGSGSGSGNGSGGGSGSGSGRGRGSDGSSKGGGGGGGGGSGGTALLACLSACADQDPQALSNMAVPNAEADVPCKDGCNWAPLVDRNRAPMPMSTASETAETVDTAAAAERPPRAVLLSPILPDWPWALAARGEHAKVPVLQGNTLDDGNGFVTSNNFLNLTVDANQSAFGRYIERAWGADVVDQIAQRYPFMRGPSPSLFSPYFWRSERMETDFTFTCPAKRAAAWFGRNTHRHNRSSSSHGSSQRSWGRGGEVNREGAAPAGTDNIDTGRVWQYLFAHHGANDAGADAGWRTDSMVGHGADMPYVWHILSDEGVGTEGPGYLLSSAMVQYWSNFARCSDPNNNNNNRNSTSMKEKCASRAAPSARSLPVWPAVFAGSFPALVLDTLDGKLNITVDTAFHQAECDMWDGLYARYDQCNLVPRPA